VLAVKVCHRFEVTGVVAIVNAATSTDWRGASFAKYERGRPR
jgi:hypothetical protein